MENPQFEMIESNGRSTLQSVTLNTHWMLQCVTFSALLSDHCLRI